MQGDWRRYPYRLVPSDSQLDFPAAEGTHPDYESDTWYLAGHLTVEASGRHFAFIAIFNRNRPGGDVVADFHTFALFDVDRATYGTFTDYDMPPKNMEPGAHPKLTSAEGYLDLRYDSSAGTTVWAACRDSAGELMPYTYDFVAFGRDYDGAGMELRLHVTPTRPPVPVGGSTYNGKIVACLQDDTYSYFQTGMRMVGTLRWGDVAEEVVGHSGHVDRQWFPRYAGGGATGGDARGQAHEWHTISLDNGVDLSVWRQFDRRIGNAVVPFSGVTASYADGSAPACVEDLEVTTTGYVRWPNKIRTLVRPPSGARYLPDRHRISSKELELELTCEPVVRVPAHALPIEYIEGPYHYRGTMAGRAVTGFGIAEATNAMYRDWELVDVLATQLARSDSAPENLDSAIDELRSLIARRHTKDALDYLDREMRPLLNVLSDDESGELLEILDALADAVREGLR
ncbi:lipocalin-like domain-containing protein [Mycobacterium sp. Aquia_213]|uniref:lipocalin-like domain-containing protein n=1 Tax=Mycobacterium sp. Aquia_213 TaxID=2991728 RepID=UPI00226E8E1B|nr:lipocalin-like domain-containing protein [Mycobacterium sp. Aquia_213]WAC94465.1 secreted hydrolase [Mycobacterium sp. Aquia_213]